MTAMMMVTNTVHTVVSCILTETTQAKPTNNNMQATMGLFILYTVCKALTNPVLALFMKIKGTFIQVDQNSVNIVLRNMSQSRSYLSYLM